MRLLSGQNKKQLIDDVVRHRANYAGFITILLAILVLVTSSAIVLNAESRADNASITSGGDAFWWSFVTITTVGYGDFYPVTTVGRIGAMFVMVMGIGIIGALASILASVLTGPTEEVDAPEGSDATDSLAAELAAVRGEIAELRRIVEGIDRRLT
jgi:voltage-gated potassium channel